MFSAAGEGAGARARREPDDMVDGLAHSGTPRSTAAPRSATLTLTVVLGGGPGPDPAPAACDTRQVPHSFTLSFPSTAAYHLPSCSAAVPTPTTSRMREVAAFVRQVLPGSPLAPVRARCHAAAAFSAWPCSAMIRVLAIKQGVL